MQLSRTLVRLLRPVFPPGSQRRQLARGVVRGLRGQDRVQVVWDRFARSHPDVVFVQIGSHNGRDGDPLAIYIDCHPRWRGVMVEPMPHHFASLQSLRGGNPRFQLVQAAIAEQAGTVEMITVDATPEMPAWADQLSSIHREVVLKHERLVPGLGQHIRTITVVTMTVAKLIEGLDRIDVLHIDTEGHDAAILDQFDLEHHRPSVVMFEHKHLRQCDRNRCSARLSAAGYKLTSNLSDTIGIRHG